MAGEEVEGLSLIFQGIRLRAAPFPAFDEFQSCRCSRASSFNRKRAITGHLIVRENNRITSSARGSNKNRTVAAYPPSARRTWPPTCKKRRKSKRLIVLEIRRGVEARRSGKLLPQPCFHASPAFQARTIARHVACNHT